MSWASNEGSWGNCMEEMKEESIRNAKEQIRKIAMFKNDGKVPLCIYCNRCVSEDMKAPDKVNLQGQEVHAHENCHSRAVYKGGQTHLLNIGRR